MRGSGLIGVVLILGAIAYFGISLVQVNTAFRSGGSDDRVLRILQVIAAPFLLFISGGILWFQGWRQDPVLQFKDFLMTIVIGYLVVLDLKKSSQITRR